MINRIPQLKEICEKNGLEIDEEDFNYYLNRAERINGEGFAVGIGIGEKEFVDYILEICLIPCLQVKKDVKFFPEEEASEKQLPEWMNNGISFESDSTNGLKAVYHKNILFERTIWLRYQNKENFTGVLTLQDLKKCKLLETFNKEKAKQFIESCVIERLIQITKQISKKCDFERLINAIKEEIIGEYRTPRTIKIKSERVR